MPIFFIAATVFLCASQAFIKRAPPANTCGYNAARTTTDTDTRVITGLVAVVQLVVGQCKIVVAIVSRLFCGILISVHLSRPSISGMQGKLCLVAGGGILVRPACA